LEGLRSSWGPQKQERKNNHNSTIFWAKNEIRMNFLLDKQLEFLFLNEVLKNWLYNINNEQILISKSLFVVNLLKKS
jgi:hypothetical protein